MKAPIQEPLFQLLWKSGHPYTWKNRASEQHFFTPDKLSEGEKRAVGIKV